MPNDELRAILSLADINGDLYVDIDEFMHIITGSDPSIYKNEKALVALFNIKRSKMQNPLDLIRLITNIPNHFVPSFIMEQHKQGKNLPSHGIELQLSHGGVSFSDILSKPQDN